VIRRCFAGLLAAQALGWSLPAAADLVTTIERVKPSVVMVGVFNRLGSPQFTLRGTGFVVGDGRTIATNAHVVTDLNLTEGAALVIRAASPGDRALPARLVSEDKTHDLALLSIEGGTLPPLSLGDSDAVKEGASIGFIGFPIGGVLGFAPVTHRGMVSSITQIALPAGNTQQLKSNVVRRLKEGSFNIFQLDATAYPGNSGGPMFDAETGEVVGIINMVFVKGTREAALSQPSGISYAIPAKHLRALFEARK
jgi:S1-C subfamily serine protease